MIEPLLDNGMAFNKCNEQHARWFANMYAHTTLSQLSSKLLEERR